MFDKEIYIQRRSTLLSLLKGQKGIAVFIGNGGACRNYSGNEYDFRQDSSFLYLWGLDEAYMAATLDLESGEECIYADDVTLDDIVWMGPQESVHDKAASVGVAKSRPYKDFFEVVRTEKETKGRPVHFLPASRHYTAKCLGSITSLPAEETMCKDKNGCPAASLPLVKAMTKMRLVKSSEEIDEIDKSCEVGCLMHDYARLHCVPGVKEQELVGKMEGIAASNGWGVSFSTILSQHGETLHNPYHRATIEKGKLLLVDAGFESSSHYASDFTRTFPCSGKFTTKQKEIYEIVLGCNNLAFSLVKPGVSYLDIQKKVYVHMLEGLSSLGLVKGDAVGMMENGVAGMFMPHGLGHNMGLDCHDMEDYGENIVGYDEDQTRSGQLGMGSLRMARRLEAGNVITDEPGIYFIPDLIERSKACGKWNGCINWEALKAYYDFGGIRIEDDVLVTADGARRLGKRRLPATVAEVEESMKNNTL